MTNNDEIALKLKPVGKFMFEVCGRQWHHIRHGDAQFTEPRLPMVKLYSEETVKSLLVERDADKKRIAELSEALKKSQDQSSKWLEAYHKAVSVGARYEERIAELEARTVSVKLPENTPLAEAPEHIWLQTAGVWPENGEFSELTWCSDNQHRDDTLYVRADLAAGINLEVGE